MIKQKHSAARVEGLESRRLFATYYVDLAAAENPNATGLADEKWNSIDDVNAKKFESGDVIRFKAGGTYTGTIEIGTKMGTWDAATADYAILPDADSEAGIVGITINTYDVDDLGNPLPAAGGTAYVNSGQGHGLVAANVGGVEVSDLNFTGTGQGPDPVTGQPIARNGVWVVNPLVANTSVQYAGVKIHDVKVQGYGKYGVLIGSEGAAGGTKRGFSDVEITRVTAQHNIYGGIASLGAFNQFATGYAHSNVRVTYCVASNNTGFAGAKKHTGDGIVLADIDGAYIEHNVAHTNGANHGGTDGGPVGVWVWDVNNAQIRYNESYNNKTNGPQDGGGFDFDGGVTNSVMEYNYSHGNDGAGIGIYQFSDARELKNLVVRYNISANDGRKNSYGGIDFWNGNGTWGVKDVLVHNNTVYVEPSTTTTTSVNRKGQTVVTTTKLGDPRALRFISGTSGVTIQNNNFITTGGVMLAQIDARQTNLRIEGNNWFSSGGAFALKSFAKVYTSASAWSKATGYERGDNTLSVDPNFEGRVLLQDGKQTKLSTVPTVGVTGGINGALTDSQLSVFQLKSTSPVRNAGVAVQSSPFGLASATADFFGNALISGGAPTVGAHELA